MDLSSIANDLETCDVSDVQSIAKVAIQLARQIQTRAKQLQTPAERRQQAELDRMVQHPSDKAILTQLTDQAFRSSVAARSADQLVHILDVQGIPRFFSPIEQAMLRGFQSFGGYLPGVAVPLVKEKMRQETANVILPAETEMLQKHLDERRDEGVRMNVNFLGEAMLGEKEAQRRLEAYLHALQLPEIECVSVKISTLYSQISTVARDETIRTVGNRLELLYRAANRNLFRKKNGEEVPKFVYLDMEEYRDMSLTSEVFMKTLDREGMGQVRAGIALQAYVPDSHPVQMEITEWAKQRVANGGKPVTIRIVKGANMEMERVEASHRCWPQAPYQEKIDTDANYKKMVVYGLQPENIAAVQLGIASHNLFEVAFSIVLAAKLGVLESIQFEMLEGMANHQRRALHELVDNLLLYAPACHRKDFIHAIGYLVRRMDENTGPDNFLRHAFKIEVDSPDWQKMEGIFTESIAKMDSVSTQPRRTQDRRKALRELPEISPDWREFVNEPDTDFSLPANADWSHSIVAEWEPRCDSRATEVPVTIAGQDEAGKGRAFESLDPSRPGVVVAKYQQADEGQIKAALSCAKTDPTGWRDMDSASRYELLRKVAQEIRVRRGDLIGAALADAGKTVFESDPEISEAVDFVEFYASTAMELQQRTEFNAQPVGVVIVVSPWNFPIAIPCGGIVAALAAGNTVILKPASDTVLPARVLCECFWDAGVPREALQLIACGGSDAGKYLLSDPEINTVILTGGTETAQRILDARPELKLLAETGGKNATIVSSLSDRDLAIKNVIHSAFSHAGQKCSATSLLILEEEVYHDKAFRGALIDAVESMKVGSAWNLKTKMGPLIRPPEGALARGLKELEPGETWASMARDLDDNPCLYSPGVKWDVSRGSFTHLTELFGPMLGVMSYRDLGEAIDMVHETGFGLTSGFESLDDREQATWISRLQAGNLYVNRSTTGAIVLRQPFGGMGKSAFGPGIKAGGPNYVVPLMKFRTLSDHELSDTPPKAPELEPLSIFWQQLATARSDAAQKARELLGDHQWLLLKAAISSYDRFALSEIRASHDTMRLVGQDNLRRYQPMTHVRIRVQADDTPLDICARSAAVVAAGGRGTISYPSSVHTELLETLEELTHEWAGNMEFLEETDEELAAAIRDGQVDRVRYASAADVPLDIRKAADEQFIHVADSPVSAQGRIELLWYVREQSVCIDYHRYGNLGFRANEDRSEVL